MIKIKLKDSVFSAGGIFEGIQQDRAVLFIGTGKQEGYTGVQNPVYSLYGSEHYNAINPTNVLPVTLSGVEIYDYSLESYRTNGSLYAAFFDPMMDLMQRNIIEILQNGVVLSYAALRTFVAP